MTHRGLAVAVLALACTSARADVAPTSASLPKVITACANERCEAVLPFGDGTFLLCIDDRSLGPRAKQTVPVAIDDRGATVAMKRDGQAWCAAMERNARMAIRVGARTLVVDVTPPTTDPSRPALNRFTYLDAVPDRRATLEPGGLHRGTKAMALRGQDVEPSISARAIGQPVASGQEAPPPDGSPLEPPGLPDDRAYLDVVAVGDAGSLHCTGIAITADAVLTAAHCLPATQVALAVRTTQVLHTTRVRQRFAHPVLDVAVLRLETALPVKPRPRRGATPVGPPVGIVRVVGFGIDDPRKGSGFGVKRRADVVVSDWGCDASRGLSAGCIRGAEMVIAAIGGRDTCWGDSGGPVLEPFGETWRLIAITSRPTLRGGASCGRGGVYVRVDVVDAWLTQTLEDKP